MSWLIPGGKVLKCRPMPPLEPAAERWERKVRKWILFGIIVMGAVFAARRVISKCCVE